MWKTSAARGGEGADRRHLSSKRVIRPLVFYSIVIRKYATLFCKAKAFVRISMQALSGPAAAGAQPRPDAGGHTAPTASTPAI
ncbi:hypothetical protein LNP74_29105 [Klebsiella pneumoniae subsp. pneumoniae]|nr:hypothetical protein [Klebsiella pneumoniae subsp. pneumoniae]